MRLLHVSVHIKWHKPNLVILPIKLKDLYLFLILKVSLIINFKIYSAFFNIYNKIEIKFSHGISLLRTITYVPKKWIWIEFMNARSSWFAIRKIDERAGATRRCDHHTSPPIFKRMFTFFKWGYMQFLCVSVKIKALICNVRSFTRWFLY